MIRVTIDWKEVKKKFRLQHSPNREKIRYHMLTKRAQFAIREFRSVLFTSGTEVGLDYRISRRQTRQVK